MKATYPKAIVQRCIPNGKSVSIDKIAESIVEGMEILDGGIKKVIILFDREDRKLVISDIFEKIHQKIGENPCNRSLYIGISDREIENWIVADVEKMIDMYDDEYHYPGDGTNGKDILKKLHGDDQPAGEKARLLKQCCASSARKHSPSLDHFLAQIDFPWAWADA
jgi:hypothetical protein